MVFSIIGGDERMLFLRERLKEQGHRVRLCGFQKHESHPPSSHLGDALFGADIIVLPLPSTKDGVTVWTPFGEDRILLSDIASAKDRKTLLLTAGTTLGTKREIDYFAREEMAVLNAIPTAEGAIEVAMKNTDRTLWHSKCLVAGFGRIGKLLCHRLCAFGCEVFASARRKESISWIKAYGYNAINHEDLSEYIGDFDIVFNTVPEQFIDAKILKKVKDECLIIELASAPFGVDFTTAEKLNIKAIKASGLPAKIAPKTAADIILETINNIQKEQY